MFGALPTITVLIGRFAGLRLDEVAAITGLDRAQVRQIEMKFMSERRDLVRGAGVTPAILRRSDEDFLARVKRTSARVFIVGGATLG